MVTVDHEVTVRTDVDPRAVLHHPRGDLVGVVVALVGDAPVQSVESGLGPGSAPGPRCGSGQGLLGTDELLVRVT